MIYENLDGVIQGHLAAKGKSLHYYLQYLYYALEGVRETGFDIWGSIQTEKVTPDNLGIIRLPADFVDVILLGVETGQQVIPLIENKYLNRSLPVNSAGNLSPRTDNFTPAGRYTLIRERGEIQVSSGTSENLVLYYITDQTRLTINTVIHPYLIDTIKKYMDWCYERDRVRPMAGRVSEAKQEYREALMILRGRKNRLSRKKILELIRKNKFYGLR